MSGENIRHLAHGQTASQLLIKHLHAYSGDHHSSIMGLKLIVCHDNKVVVIFNTNCKSNHRVNCRVQTNLDFGEKL